MIWSVVSEGDIMLGQGDFQANNNIRSSNPYDYLRLGFFLDNASMYGGMNFVNFNSNISGNRTGYMLHFPSV